MKHIFFLFAFAGMLCLSLTSVKKDSWVNLFNGKDLSGWDTYLGPDLDDNGKPLSATPLGLNNDPRKVFTIVNENGEKIIRISGENWGAITTKQEYENYHLQLQFKWGKLLWGQKKKGNKKDSGLLYHSVGKFGADYMAWMRAQEFQVEEGNCGDYWGCAGGAADIPAVKRSETDYVYDANGPLLSFSDKSKNGRHCIKQAGDEKPSGEWNTLDLYCHGDTSIHVLNGKVAMVLYHNSQIDNGTTSPMAKGKIQLQSEGAEIFYRNIRMQPINRLPVDLTTKGK
ncbi:DUF1080 domain-containing protein [Mucilaginibacter koreensis]